VKSKKDLGLGDIIVFLPPKEREPEITATTGCVVPNINPRPG